MVNVEKGKDTMAVAGCTNNANSLYIELRMSEKSIKPIVLLSGPIGAGKTTVAKELIKSATDPTVYIEGDRFWSFLAKGHETFSRKSKFITTMTSIVAASVPYALNGFEVILDFSIPPWFLDTVRKIVEKRNIPLEYIVVLPSENICAQRATSRDEGAIPDYSFFHDFYMKFTEAEKYTISDDARDAQQMAAWIDESRKEGKFKVRLNH